ncbi:MAG: hypothetical protein AAGA34_07415 [Pseudomonadota bacterium]
MSQLPDYVRRLPYVFYGLAILMGGWRFFNEWSVMSSTMQFAPAGDEFADMRFLARSNAFYWGVADVVYISASAAMLQILLGIYDKLAGVSE